MGCRPTQPLSLAREVDPECLELEAVEKVRTHREEPIAVFERELDGLEMRDVELGFDLE